MSIFKGVNTYESTQIKDFESKYALNCWNNQGKLKKEDYKIDFDIPVTKQYEREYDSMGFEQDTSDSVDRFSLEFIDNDDVKTSSGLIKPTASVFVDTTREEKNAYLRTIENLNKITFPINTLFGDKLVYSLKDNAVDCEVYQYVEIAVSYSGPYGESGLTWFRLPNYTLHGVIFIDNLFGSFMRTNPQAEYDGRENQSENYKYVNVYIKYGNLENLSLLMKIDLTSDEFYKSYESPIEIDYDNNEFDDEESKSYNFYTWFERRRTKVSGDQEDFGEISDEYADDNNFISKNDCTLAIYTGLFQFEDPDKMNLSWFVSNRYLPNQPTVEVETQTYLSNDDYDILNDKYDNILSEFESNQKEINTATNNVPFMTKFGWIDGWNTGAFTDTVFGTWNEYNTKGLISNTHVASDECNSDVRNNEVSLNDFAWGSIYKNSHFGDTFDLFGKRDIGNDGALNPFGQPNSDGSIFYQQTRYETSGTLLFQFWQEIDGEFNLITTQNVSVKPGTVISQFQIPNFFSKYMTNAENWRVDVWYSKINDVANPADEIDKNWYKIYTATALTLLLSYVAFGYGSNSDLDVTGAKAIKQAQIKQQLNGNDNTKSNDIPYRAGLIMCEDEEADDLVYTDLFIILNIGLLYDKKDEIQVSLITEDEDGLQDKTLISETVQDDYESLDTNAEGIYNKDWKVLENGLKITNTDKLNVRVKTRHLESYDGRLWQSCKDEADEFQDLYYSVQNYPEMFLETNFKGYESHITGLKEFIEQLYVFENDQVNVVKKSLTRELNGIIEPTYQYHKTFDKGAIEWTVKEHEKKLYFTNEEGQYYIDATGNYRKMSMAIDRLFKENYINDDTVDFAEIKDNFYVIRMKTKIPGSAFFDIDFSREKSSINPRNFDVEYIAFDCDSGEYWLGNNVFDQQFVYMTKDFDGRNKYDDFTGVNQLKRISVDYDEGFFYMYQIKNRHFPIAIFPFPEQNGYRRPIRHTLSGQRNNYFGFILIGHNDVEIVDISLVENGK